MDIPSTSGPDGPSSSGQPEPQPQQHQAFSSPTKQRTGAFGTASLRSPRVTYSDRFIPSRATSSRLDFSILDRETAASETPRRTVEKEESNGAYNMLLRSELLGCPAAPLSPEKNGGGGMGGTSASGVHPASPSKSPSRKLFRYLAGDADTPTAGLPTQSPYARGPIGGDDSAASTLASPTRMLRKIPRAPFKVLDAPAVADDYYLNLVDWSAQNTLAVGLGTCVYLWSACTSKVTRLVDFGDGGAVCSVSWSQRGSFLSIGTDKGEVQIWDATKCKRIRTLAGHKQRVGCMAWSHHTLATGSRDRSILLRDVRAQEPYVQKLNGHRSEVCGLRWSPDDRELASGGNDNQLFVWQQQSAQPVLRFSEHQAAVKAIAWSPHQHGLLVSGGGTADRCIRFWNTTTGQPLQCIDTGSQVCNLSWSKNVNELVSTHGYSQNQIIVWRYPTMQKLATLTGHTMRVLYLAVSPDGQTIVTGAGDETLRFWNVFPGPKTQGSGSDSGMGSMMRTLIR
ncbi:hypothetical protein D9Q98_005094 [Chlorella vulgaris]|uniref:CDC20/Fizzy WD40 domain-containing protein n=1 Tax=Chlorella vulgaris TaxID=3077 RepID=A0A9D4YXC0_CHLVU|nr:hypothetical protein D9Q98_005094 [Chlorella vulgaris]